jgi:hypothetical protein
VPNGLRAGRDMAGLLREWAAVRSARATAANICHSAQQLTLSDVSVEFVSCCIPGGSAAAMTKNETSSTPAKAATSVASRPRWAGSRSAPSSSWGSARASRFATVFRSVGIGLRGASNWHELSHCENVFSAVSSISPHGSRSWPAHRESFAISPPHEWPRHPASARRHVR